MRYLAVLSLLSLLAFSQSVFSQTLVDNRKADGEVILAANSDLRERLGARELVYWIKQITKVKLPLLALPSKNGNTKIFIGKKWAQELFPDDLEFLKGTDGYAVRKRGDNIYIFGVKPAGTMFGVWKFIEKNTDLIWARPNAKCGTVFSYKSSLILTSTDFREKPTFWYRSWAAPGGIPDFNDSLWKARNGCATALIVNLPMRGWHYRYKELGGVLCVGGGFMYGFLGKYQKTRPDFFPVVNGKRTIKNHAQPCLSNPYVLKTLIYEAKKLLQNAPEETKILVCSNEDTWTSCECKNCLKPILLKDGSKLSPKSVTAEGDQLFRSTQTYMFLNKVAENLTEDYPDLLIQTLAYIYAAEPPAVKLNPAIMALFCPYPTCNMRFPVKDAVSKNHYANWSERFEKWKKQPCVLAFYMYYGLRYFNAVAETSAIDLQDLAQCGGVGITSCETLQDVETSHFGFGKFSYFWDTTGMEIWIISRLLWNPYLNVAQLRNYYLRRTFRKAYPEMKKFFAIINKNWHDKKRKGFETIHSGPSGVFTRYIVDPGDEKKAQKILTKALGNAKDPRSKELVSRIISRFDNLAGSLNRLLIPSTSNAIVASQEFESPFWYNALKLTDFKLTRRALHSGLPKNKTELIMLQDDNNLYFRLNAFESEMAAIKQTPKSGKECFPLGEHFEILLQEGKKGAKYFFAFDSNGNKYDSKNWDAGWNCNWRVKSGKKKNGWRALITIPIKDIKSFNSSKKLSLQGAFARINNRKDGFREEITFKGLIFNGPRMSSLDTK
jgi:hypothetical protein